MFRSRFALIAAAAAVAFLPAAAIAADLSVKARPNSFLTYPLGCGFYYGAAFSGAAGGGNGSTISGTQVLAGDIGAVLGWTCPVGASSFWFAEGIASVSKVNGGDPAAKFSLAGAFSAEQRVGVGVPWSTVQALVSAVPGLQGVSMPSLPLLPGVTGGAVNPYIFAGLNERDISAQVLANVGKAWLVSGEIGFGSLTRMSNGMVLDTWVKYQPASTKLKIGIAGQNFQTGDFVGVGMAIKL